MKSLDVISFSSLWALIRKLSFVKDKLWCESEFEGVHDVPDQ